jgi:hypothetical protein
VRKQELVNVSIHAISIMLTGDTIAVMSYLRRGCIHGIQILPGSNIGQHTSAYVSMRAWLSRMRHMLYKGSSTRLPALLLAYVSVRQHTSAHVSIRQHTSACVSMRA